MVSITENVAIVLSLFPQKSETTNVMVVGVLHVLLKTGLAGIVDQPHKPQLSVATAPP